MSIATAISDLSGRIQDAYTALSAKGATMPATKDSYHLSATVDTIQAGGDNVKYMVDPTLSGGVIYDEDATLLRPYAFAYLISSVEEVNLPNVIAMTNSSTGATSLTAAWSSVFNYCLGLKRLIMPKFTNTSNTSLTSTFNRLSNLTCVVLPSWTGGSAGTASNPRIFGNANIKHIEYGKREIDGYQFTNSTSLEELLIKNCDYFTTDALAGCTALSLLEMKMPNLLNGDWQGVLSDSTHLTNVKLHEYSNYTQYTYSDGYLTRVFPYVQNLSIEVSGSVSHSHGQGFAGSQTLSTLNVSADKGMFVGLSGSSVREASISATTMFFDSHYCFADCTQLKRMDLYQTGTFNFNFLPVGGFNHVLDGVTYCHFYFHYNITDAYLDTLKTQISPGAYNQDFSTTNILHLLSRGTKLVWDSTTSEWVEMEDS